VLGENMNEEATVKQVATIIGLAFLCGNITGFLIWEILL
jgi:hypothetical protein